MSTKGTPVKKANTRDEWIACIADLLSRIEKWACQENWETAREEKEITEDLIGTYSVPTLKIRTPNGLVYVEPVAQNVIGADGRVDIYSWPSLHRLLLIRREDHWSLKTDSGVDWPNQWGKKAFVELAHNLTKAP